MLRGGVGCAKQTSLCATLCALFILVALGGKNNRDHFSPFALSILIRLTNEPPYAVAQQVHFYV